MESVEEVRRKKQEGKGSRFGKRYGFELKLRCVKLRLEEGVPPSLISKEVGVSKTVLHRWVKAYQEKGEAGLRNQVSSSGGRQKLPGAVRSNIKCRNQLGVVSTGIIDIRDPMKPKMTLTSDKGITVTNISDDGKKMKREFLPKVDLGK